MKNAIASTIRPWIRYICWLPPSAEAVTETAAQICARNHAQWRQCFNSMARPRTGASGRALFPVLLRKIFEDLNADLLRDRAFDPAHPVPEPDDLALFFDVHESTSREWPIRT